MALDGTILARARAALAQKKQDHEKNFNRRTLEVYDKVPTVCAIDEDIRRTMTDVFGTVLSKAADTEAIVRRLGEENLRLQDKRRRALKEAGYPENYLDETFMCDKCRDTGYIGYAPCSCLMALYKKEQNREFSNLLRLSNESFDAFDLSFYPEEYNSFAARENMQKVLNTCRKYAERFGTHSNNLFFTGAPGLGKTYLSACVAKTVAEKNYSVVYTTAIEVFGAFENAHFSRGDIYDDAKAAVTRYLNCDLLILDDLGTEMTTTFTISALYELINTRLVSGKKTLISTNLSVEEVEEKYSAQIASRIKGEYLVLPFFGEDIRILKKKDK